MNQDWVCLTIIKMKDGSVRSHLIDKESFNIGRTQEADLPIIEQSVSRLHLTVQLKNQSIYIRDRKSANGSTRNGMPLGAETDVAVLDSDIIKLGTAELEFTFLAIPRPFELMNTDTQKISIMGSMEEIAKQVEKKHAEQAEKFLRRAKLEADQLVSEARKEAEILKTQGLLELQQKKQVLETEIAKARQEAQSVSANERIAAKREADNLIADAQKRIQKDYEDANRNMESQLKETQDRSMKILEDAAMRAEKSIAEARDEAQRMRREASEEARQMQQEAFKKSTETLTTFKEKLYNEVNEKREQMLEQAKVDAQRERDRILSDAQPQIDAAMSAVRVHTDKLGMIKAELDQTELERSNVRKELTQMQKELSDARELLANVTDLEKRRESAEKDFRHYMKVKEEGMAKLESELREHREKGLIDVEKRKHDLEADINKARLKALEDVQRAINAEEQKYEQTRKLRALELSSKIGGKLLTRLDGWMQAPDTAAGQLKSAVEEACNEVLLADMSTIRAMPVEAIQAPVASQEHRDKRNLRTIGYVAAALCVFAIFFRHELYGYFKGVSSQNLSSEIMQKRRAENQYKSPKLGDLYQETYTDNVLHMRRYTDIKSDPDAMEKWTLKLNDLAFVRSLGVGEDDMVRFLAKETNMVQRLAVLREAIDGRYPDEGIGAMRKAENEDLREIKEILKGDGNYRKVRDAEREFLIDFIRKNP